MNDVLYENDRYKVILFDEALGEDGKYGHRGYAVVNIGTAVVEHTTMVLPQALFQADAFMGALAQLDEVEEDTALIEGIEPETIQ